jgi:hypothetical protein
MGVPWSRLTNLPGGTSLQATTQGFISDDPGFSNSKMSTGQTDRSAAVG